MTKMAIHNLGKVLVQIGRNFFIVFTCSVLLLSCSNPSKNNTISEKYIYGEWNLESGEKQVNYPCIIFHNDSSVELFSRADTVYYFTFFIRKDTLYTSDIYGKQYKNKIIELKKNTLVLKNIIDIYQKQKYTRAK